MIFEHDFRDILVNFLFLLVILLGNFSYGVHFQIFNVNILRLVYEFKFVGYFNLVGFFENSHIKLFLLG